MKKTVAVLFAALISLSVLHAEEKVSLNSGQGVADWYMSPQGEDSWIPAVVPGASYTSYVEAGLEPDPNFGDNAYKVDRKKFDRNYLYRTELATESLPCGEFVWLCFEGINRRGKIYFNGEHLGDLDGFMDRGKFNIAPYLKKDGSANELSVLVISPKDPIPNYASPTYISSAGWDWMPYAPGLLGGITDDVYVTASGKVSIVDPWVRTSVPVQDKGIISLAVGLRNNSSEEKEVLVRGEILPGNIKFEKKVRVRANRPLTCHITEREFPQLAINNPKLWWPNGYGEQNLYTCRLECVTDGEISDAQDVTFGIREYSYAFVDDVFQLSVNGEKIYCKGGNWGMSEWLLRCRGEEYDLKIRLHNEMGFNMIRNWIGSTTDDEFYQACDRYGIMVFDDFWLNSHPNLPDDVTAFNHNAIEKIKRLRNHPCIAVWCGDNEGVPLPPINEWLRENVKTYDGGDRWYQPISREYGFSGSGPWVNAHPIWYFTDYPAGFGEHKQDGWGFRSEIGTAVFTNYESYKKFMPDPEQWPMDKDMLNKHFFGMSSFNSRPDRYMATVDYNYGPSESAEEFCTKAQLLNIEANKAMYEGWQHNMWNDASGILTWMSQSAYPSFVWQTYDYYYDLNGAYWGAKEACEPLHIQWSYADNSIKVVNAGLESYDNLRAVAKVYDIHGNELEEYGRSAVISVRPDRASYVMSIDLPEDDNLARGKKACSSSDGVRDYLTAGALTDGNTGSAWSAQRGDRQWAYVDFGKPETFDRVVLSWESFSSKKYELMVSDDAESWKSIHVCETGSEPIQKIDLEPVTARYLKVQNIESQRRRNMAMHEIEVYNGDAPAGRLTPVHFIRLELLDSDGNVLSENFYWRSLRLGDYTALNSLQPAKLAMKTSTEVKDGKMYVTAKVTNKGGETAFAVRVMPVYASTGEQVLPVFMDKNYFTIFKGETRTVRMEIDMDVLGGEQITVTAKPYNR